MDNQRYCRSSSVCLVSVKIASAMWSRGPPEDPSRSMTARNNLWPTCWAKTSMNRLARESRPTSLRSSCHHRPMFWRKASQVSTTMVAGFWSSPDRSQASIQGGSLPGGSDGDPSGGPGGWERSSNPKTVKGRALCQYGFARALACRRVR